MTRPLAALTLLLALALPTASSTAQSGAMPAPDCHGTNVTDKTGDSADATVTQTQGGPSSDLVAGWITYDPASGKSTANIQVDELVEGGADAPWVAISWEFQFTTAAGPRYVRAYHDVAGMTKYNWGEPRAITDDQTTPRAGGDTTGTLFPGKNGVVQIEMPLADLGAKPGTQLKALALETRQWASLPAAVPNTGLPIYSPAPIYDTAAGKGAFDIGPCKTAPAAPAAPATPATPAVERGRFDVKVTVPKLSARKLARAKKFTVKLRGTASELKAVVRKRLSSGKNLARGSLKSLNGSGKLTLKGKLKKGRYVLAFSGRDAQGRPAEGAVRISVGR